MSDPDVLSPPYAALEATGGTGSGGVDLWLLRAADMRAEVLAVEVLDQQEKDRAAAFMRSGDRARYIAAHVALRRLLAACTGKPARDLVFMREACPCCGAPHGRPALSGLSRSLHFSLSHGGDLILIGIADKPIGVDVEAEPDLEQVADFARLMHPAERSELAETPLAQQVAAFTRLWTRKEAYLKGLGTGLGRDPNADYLGSTGIAAPPPGWTIDNISADPGYAAAFAVQTSAGGTAQHGRPRRLPSTFTAPHPRVHRW